MDFKQALLALVEPMPDETDGRRAEAAATLSEGFRVMHNKVLSLERENEAIKRVVYLLVEDTANEELRNEMHATYTKISSGTESPEE